MPWDNHFTSSFDSFLAATQEVGIISPSLQKRKKEFHVTSPSSQSKDQGWKPPKHRLVSLRAQLCGADRHGCRSEQDGFGAQWKQENTEGIGKKGRGQGSWESSKRGPRLQEGQVGIWRGGILHILTFLEHPIYTEAEHSFLKQNSAGAQSLSIPSNHLHLSGPTWGRK